MIPFRLFPIVVFFLLLFIAAVVLTVLYQALE